MNLFNEQCESVQVADRPPVIRGELTPAEQAESNAALLDAMTDEPEVLANVLSAAVYRLRPAALQRVAKLVLELTT